MKNTNGHSTEILKKSVENVSQKSKEAIKTLIDSNSKQFDSAFEANKKNFDGLSKLLYDKEMDPSILSFYKTNFGKGIKLSEEAIDSIIDIHKKRIELSIDFVNDFAELIKMDEIHTKKGTDKLMSIVKEYFDRSTELSIKNMENMVSIYNNHLNLALNFNTKFAESVNTHIMSMFELQKKNFDSFFGFETLNRWWKGTVEEKV